MYLNKRGAVGELTQQRKDAVTIEVDMGVMRPQAKDCWQLSGAQRGKKQNLSSGLQEVRF